MTIKNLTTEQKQNIIKNHTASKQEKLTQEHIGTIYGVSARTIYRVLVEAGCITPGMRSKNCYANPMTHKHPLYVTPTKADVLAVMPFPNAQLNHSGARKEGVTKTSITAFVNTVREYSKTAINKLSGHSSGQTTG